MLFNTAIFGFFFVLFFALFSFVARTRGQKLWAITLASLIFYAAWDYRLVPLLLGTPLVDFYLARQMDAASARQRTALLVLSLVANLGVLACFKYSGLVLASGAGLLSLVGFTWRPPELGLVLPIGISFYTFQSMSYTIDVYRRELTARRRPLEFLSAVLFFPHLVAGPIVRASTLLPQFERFAAPEWHAARRGLLLVAVGLFKKTCADLLGPVADRVFSGTAAHGAADAWTGALAFAGQIYGDFSGYTDIAIGVALMIGIALPANFDAPYLASSPVDFWRRWHISLSSWLRDYLYIPLGGNRTHRYRNLMLTMLLGGLWHGAALTFVVWGGYHGALIAGTHLCARIFPVAVGGRVVHALRIALTFYLVVIGWVLFRASSLAKAWAMLRTMHGAGPAVAPEVAWNAWMATTAVLVVIGLLAPHLSSALASGGPAPRALGLRWAGAAACLAFAIAFDASREAFLYFQF